jgi:hypothetical protein
MSGRDTPSQQAAVRQQRLEDERKLRDQRRADEQATKSAQQKELRGKYGSSATAAAAALGEEVKAWTANRVGYIGTMYPEYATWLQDKLTDHWEIAAVNSELADYGAANWKGRNLDSTLARVSIKLRNRMLGRYDDACFVFGRITDTEFNVPREPMVAPCDDSAATEKWKMGNQFRSRWTVN